MRLSTIVRSQSSRSSLLAGVKKKENLASGFSAQFGNTLLLENASIPAVRISQRKQSSIRDTKQSDHGTSNNSASNTSETPIVKSNVAKSSYKPVNLAYISYEKKIRDKVFDALLIIEI